VSSSREMMGSSDMKLENLKTWNETKSEKQFLYLNWIEIVFLVNMDWLSTNMNDFIVLHCFVWNFSSHHGVLRIFTKLNLIQSDLIWSDPSIASDPSIQPASIAEQSKACLLLLYWCLQASFPSLYLPDLLAFRNLFDLLIELASTSILGLYIGINSHLGANYVLFFFEIW